MPTGMPVQVFPVGPPPAPAPPPPPPKNQLSTQSATRAKSPSDRRSPSNTNFEPPPMGCRPEIKIPPNPMANLKPAPRPQPKDEFWKEEYIRERSKSPLTTASPQNGYFVKFII